MGCLAGRELVDGAYSVRGRRALPIYAVFGCLGKAGCGLDVGRARGRWSLGKLGLATRTWKPRQPPWSVSPSISSCSPPLLTSYTLVRPSSPRPFQRVTALRLPLRYRQLVRSTRLPSTRRRQEPRRRSQGGCFQAKAHQRPSPFLLPYISLQAHDLTFNPFFFDSGTRPS